MQNYFKQLFLANILKNTQPACIICVSVTFTNIQVTAINLCGQSFESFFRFFIGDFTFFNSKLFDLWGVDNFSFSTIPRNVMRFSVNYMFFNLSFPTLRVFIKTFVNNSEFFSLSSLYWSSTWLEREIWDMFGIRFINNFDLRRILTDYGFCGFPLRKDFPTSGYTQVRYDEEIKAVISEPVRLSQKYRYFEFISPWR